MKDPDPLGAACCQRRNENGISAVGGWRATDGNGDDDRLLLVSVDPEGILLELVALEDSPEARGAEGALKVKLNLAFCSGKAKGVKDEDFCRGVKARRRAAVVLAICIRR